MATCSDCTYYEAVNGKGRCRANAPNISPAPSGTGAVWPLVDATSSADECGAFQAKS